METMLIIGIVVILALLIGSQHLLNWAFRTLDNDVILLPIVGTIISWGLIALVIVEAVKLF
jgi:hypothetical protein